MRFRKLKNLLFRRLPNHIHEDILHDINRINLARSRIIITAVIALELFAVLLFLIKKYGIYWEDRDPLYVLVYVFLAVVMAVFFAVSFLLPKKRPAYKSIRLYTCLLSGAILFWCAAVALIDQLSAGQVTLYVSAIFMVGIFPLLSPAALFAVYAPVHALFLLLLPQFRQNPAIAFANAVNTSVCIVFAFIISCMLYRNKWNDILNKNLVQNRNRELREINERLLRTNQNLEQMSSTDSLTGLLNRRMLNERLSAEWQICKSFSVPISVLMLDIDCFKRINDIYGHQTGDICLLRISNVINSVVQHPSYIVARWGGEEFILALPRAEKEKAYYLAEQIRKEVESLDDFCENFNDKITVSIGICSAVPSDSLTVRDMIEAADKALYKAKSKNGNRTEYA
ncbi:MAG: Phytochrome-like protein cph2 [Firmicutes bacterium ADurb.Bin182]|nr:MAG: Phytochrome-like protein cph2 [Firmicutes bacterium ADurb.Bin182]